MINSCHKGTYSRVSVYISSRYNSVSFLQTHTNDTHGWDIGWVFFQCSSILVLLLCSCMKCLCHNYEWQRRFFIIGPSAWYRSSTETKSDYVNLDNTPRHDKIAAILQDNILKCIFVRKYPLTSIQHWFIHMMPQCHSNRPEWFGTDLTVVLTQQTQ